MGKNEYKEQHGSWPVLGPEGSPAPTNPHVGPARAQCPGSLLTAFTRSVGPQPQVGPAPG